jgi:macrophage erythroblast attacher
LALVERQLNERSTSECLLWCFENRPHLKKSQSPLEFYLRRQTYIELARKRELMQAIQYAKKFFPPWLDQYRREIEQVMALLAIPPDTQAEPYKVPVCMHALFGPALEPL